MTVEGETTGEIGPGLLILICAMRDDPADATARMAAKIAKLRIFRDPEGRMNRSLLDTGGSALVVSQFTLAAETKGNRPGFSTAAPQDEAERAYRRFVSEMRELVPNTQTGRFGADMRVALVNDGPVTIWLDQ